MSFDTKHANAGAHPAAGAKHDDAGPGKHTQVEAAAASGGNSAGVNMATLEEFIGKHEGRVDHVYLDSRGFKTAGIGHLLAGSSLPVGHKVSAEQITAWFKTDVAKAVNGAKQDIGPAYEKLDEARRMVVIDMAFNLGAGATGFGGFHATIHAIQTGAYAQAATNMLQSLWASQVGHRATEDAGIMRSGHLSGGGGTDVSGVGGESGGGHTGGGTTHGGPSGGGSGASHAGSAPTIAQVRAGHGVLKVGERGPAVSEIQHLLHIPADGVFGNQTKAAVEKFQHAHHLTADGIIGKQTIDALDHKPAAKPEKPHTDTGGTEAPSGGKHPTTGGVAPGGKGDGKHGKWSASPSLTDVKTGKAVLHEGEKGEAVTHLQHLLLVTSDGEYGPATKAAVLAFQHEHHMQRHDGEVDAHTLDLITRNPPGSIHGESHDGSAQRQKMLGIARSSSAGKRPDGRCYYHVCQFLVACGGYGKIKNPYNQFPGGALPEAHDFADLMNSGAAAKFGIERLSMGSPYDAPAGSIVVVAAGSPGTHNPTAGDIAIADGHGNFYNGGLMGYSGPAGWNAAPRAKLLGVYVPK